MPIRLIRESELWCCWRQCPTDLEHLAHHICDTMEQAVANSFSEFEGWINNNLRHEDEDYEVYRVVENLVKHGGFDPSTMNDEDVIALVTPLLQKLVLSYLDGAREIWRVSS